MNDVYNAIFILHTYWSTFLLLNFVLYLIFLYRDTNIILIRIITFYLFISNILLIFLHYFIYCDWLKYNLKYFSYTLVIFKCTH
jgi:hypothetical protein